jgi:hypothetical protein
LRESPSRSGAENLNAHRNEVHTTKSLAILGNYQWGGKKRVPVLESAHYDRCRDYRLEFGVGVGADFAVQIDLFVLRGGPFHEQRSLG